MPQQKGEMAEWSNAHAWKACKVLKPSRVRIPLSPPQELIIRVKYSKNNKGRACQT